MKRIYLDNAASSRLDDDVLKVMLPYFTEMYAIPSSQFSHQDGIEVNDAIEDARDAVADYLNVKSSEIIFTSGETESNNLAIKGYARANASKGKHLITATNEHRSVLNTFKVLEKEGFKVTYVEVDEYGHIAPEDIKAALREDTILISIALVNHEVGTIQPLKEISGQLEDSQAVLHSNLTYGAGYLALDMGGLGLSLASLSTDKANGPKGAGVVFIKDKLKINRLFEGNFNEGYIRPGMVNVPSVMGFAAAVKMFQSNSDDIERISKLRDRMIEKLLKIENTVLNGPAVERVANNVNITFYRAEGESVVLHLDMKGISVVTGSACFSKSLEPSYVMMSMGFSHERAHGSIRATLSKYTTEDEIDRTVDAMSEVVQKLRDISPIK